MLKYNSLRDGKWRNRVSAPGSVTSESMFLTAFLSLGLAMLDAVCLHLFLCLLTMTKEISPHLMHSSIVSCTIFTVFCLKNEGKEKKNHKRKLQMFFKNLRVCGPISLYFYLIT